MDVDLIENCILESERVLTTLTHEFEDQSHFHINQPFPASFLTGPFFTIDDDRIPNLSKMIRFLHDKFSCPHDISLMVFIIPMLTIFVSFFRMPLYENMRKMNVNMILNEGRRIENCLRYSAS